jgi:hypothetical protein
MLLKIISSIKLVAKAWKKVWKNLIVMGLKTKRLRRQRLVWKIFRLSGRPIDDAAFGLDNQDIFPKSLQPKTEIKLGYIKLLVLTG